MGCSYGRFLLGVRGASWSGSLVPSLQGSGKRSCCSEAFAEQILADFEQKKPRFLQSQGGCRDDTVWDGKCEFDCRSTRSRRASWAAEYVLVLTHIYISCIELVNATEGNKTARFYAKSIFGTALIREGEPDAGVNLQILFKATC